MSSMEQTTYKIRITGVVQGVGFRPFIYNLATKYQLKGEVSNDSLGVLIMIDSDKKTLERFVKEIESDAPPLSCIESIMIEEIEKKSFDAFMIIQSSYHDKTNTLIPPDISICQACQRELFDKDNRRYLYPFITCTNCGVRYSIIKTLPYDRENTSMDKFKMCNACEKEYHDPTNRRYHAQPIGCWECGPTTNMRIDEAVKILEEGKILALKGVGGYHLLCDATNDEAVKLLRERKHRPSKPFAIMVKTLEEAKKLAKINPKEQTLLTSNKRPIVLLQAKPNTLSKYVAPHISKIGIFLPYTPLHLLVLEKCNRPLVATSANVTDEPIATNLESMQKLEGVYDALLDHDREIVNGCDDSVTMVVKNQTIMIRRARGYAPSAIKLPFKLDKKVLALGANQKNTIAIGFDNHVILSPHIGDLDTIESVGYFEKNIEILKRVYAFTPDIVACDKHPNYESTKYAKANFTNIKEIQHHYAHILSVMAEKGIKEKVLGVAFDGTGYGDDGTLWGGEFLVCDYTGYERVAHLKPFRLLGGARAIKEPRRVALSLLFDLYSEKVLQIQNPTTKAFSQKELAIHYKAWQKGLNAPLSSSMGRLFDAVASLTGICQEMSFEGESGMLLEEMYDKNITESYPIAIYDDEIDFLPMIEDIVNDKPKEAISKFFNTIVEIIIAIAGEYDLLLVLSGGVFQNRVLVELILEKIPDAIFPNEIPPNDGGVALGQVVANKPLFYVRFG